MPLRYQPITMPFGASQDESTHDFAVQSPTLQSLVNCRVNKSGSVSKRLGWTEYCPYAASVGSATVFEHDGAILLKQQNTTSFTHAPRYLSALDVDVAGADELSGPGRSHHLPEVEIIERATIWRDESGFGINSGTPALTNPDHKTYIDSGGTVGLTCIAWESRTPTQVVIIAQVVDTVTGRVVTPARIVSTPAVDCKAPRVVQYSPGPGGAFFYVVYACSATGQIRTVSYDVNARTWGADTLITAAYSAANPYFDACTEDDGSFAAWYIAYGTAAGFTVAKVSAATPIASVAIAEAPHAITVNANFANGVVWVAWGRSGTGLRVASYTLALAAGLAPTTLEASATTLTSQVTVIPYSSTGAHVLWTTDDPTNLAANHYGRPITKSRDITTGGVTGTMGQRASFSLISKAYRNSARLTYVAVLYDAANNGVGNPEVLRSHGFQTAFTMCVGFDTDINSGSDEHTWFPVATWAIGEAGFARDISTLSNMQPLGLSTLPDTVTGARELRFALGSGVVMQDSEEVLTGVTGVDLCRFRFSGESSYFKTYHTRIGNNLVLSGGITTVWDGNSLTEYGFLVPPENGRVTTDGAGTGALGAGTYAVSLEWEYTLATGDVVRSAPAPAFGVVSLTPNITTVATDRLNVEFPDLTLTKKYNDTGGVDTSLALRCIAFRTEANGSIFYREATPKDSSGVATNRPFQELTNQGFKVKQADTDIFTREQLYTTGDILPNYPLPALAHLVTHKDRVFGISAENRRNIVFTHVYDPGELPGWHPFLTFTIPDEAAALATLDEKLIILAKKGIYVVAGAGPDRKGLNSDFSLPFRLNSPHGCVSPDGVVSTPDGIMYQTPAGICLIDRNLTVSNVGGPVEDTLELYPTVLASVVWPDQELVYWSVRGFSGGGCIVYDWKHNVWAVDAIQFFTGEGGSTPGLITSFALLDGYLYCTFAGSTTVHKHIDYADPGNNFITSTVVTAPLKLTDGRGYQRCRWVSLLGERHEGINVSIYVLQDYGADSELFTFADADLSVLDYGHIKCHVSKQRGSAFWVVLQDSSDGSSPSQGYDWIGMTFDVGFKANVAKLPQVAMR